MHSMQRHIDSSTGRNNWRKPIKYLILQESPKERYLSLDSSQVRIKRSDTEPCILNCQRFSVLTKNISAGRTDLYPGGLKCDLRLCITHLAPRQTSIWNFPSLPMFLDVLLMARMKRQKCRTLVCQFSSGATSRCSALSKYTWDFSVIAKMNQKTNQVTSDYTVIWRSVCREYLTPNLLSFKQTHQAWKGIIKCLYEMQSSATGFNSRWSQLRNFLPFKAKGCECLTIKTLRFGVE